MKKALMIMLCGALLFVGIFQVSEKIDRQIMTVMQHSAPRNTVIIDAGHGGIDVGTVGIDGSLEKSINLSIALDLYDFLMVSGISSKLIRKDDSECYKAGEKREKSDLYNRMEYINSFSNTYLISIHQNHFNDEKEWGTQIWYSPNSQKSKAIADKALDCIKSNLQPNNQRINKESGSDYYLLYKAKAPSIMIECGFVSNREENEKLQNKEYQKDFAYSVLLGLCEEI